MPQGPPAEAPRQQLSHLTRFWSQMYFTIALWFLIYVGEINMSYMCGQWMFIQAVAVDMMRHHV